MNFLTLFRERSYRQTIGALLGIISLAAGPAAFGQGSVTTTTVGLGARVSMTASAEGTPAPTFQWRKNGIDISGATSAVFTIASTTALDAAIYQVIATNAAGSATSHDAVLVVDSTIRSGTGTGSDTGGNTTATAPVFASQPPATVIVAPGATASISATATGTPAPTYQWLKNGTAISGATNSTLAFGSVSVGDTATYSVVASNSAGSVTSQPAQLTVAQAPLFIAQPIGQTVTAGATVKLTAVASGDPVPSLEWQRNGVPIAGATSTDLVLSNVTSANAGTYRAIATNIGGAVTSSNAEVVVLAALSPDAVAPVIATHPVSQTAPSKSTVTFAVSASANPAPSYQWLKNGITISGAVSPSLTLKVINKSDAGEYSVRVSNVAGTAVSNKAILTVSNTSGKSFAAGEGIMDPALELIEGSELEASKIVNLSVRASVQSGENNLIVGFVMSDGAQKPVLVRAVGPTLSAFGVPGVLSDPRLLLFSGPSLSAANDDWWMSEDALQLSAAASNVGAFALPDVSPEAALISILRTGAYTVQVDSKSDSGGVALVELYDAESKSAGRLINVSARMRVGTGDDVPNIGFAIEGTKPKTVLIRAVGPTLASFGVQGVLSDPQLELYSGTTRIQKNDNWGGAQVLSAAFAKVGAFGFSDDTSQDAALLITLEPGTYSAVVSGVDGATGAILVEVYEVP